jgi:hypothetical protein
MFSTDTMCYYAFAICALYIGRATLHVRRNVANLQLNHVEYICSQSQWVFNIDTHKQHRLVITSQDLCIVFMFRPCLS